MGEDKNIFIPVIPYILFDRCNNTISIIASSLIHFSMLMFAISKESS